MPDEAEQAVIAEAVATRATARPSVRSKANWQHGKGGNCRWTRCGACCLLGYAVSKDWRPRAGRSGSIPHGTRSEVATFAAGYVTIRKEWGGGTDNVEHADAPPRPCLYEWKMPVAGGSPVQPPCGTQVSCAGGRPAPGKALPSLMSTATCQRGARGAHILVWRSWTEGNSLLPVGRSPCQDNSNVRRTRGPWSAP